MNNYRANANIRLGLFIFGLLLILGLIVYSNFLVNQLRSENKEIVKMYSEIIAKTVNEDSDTNLNFVFDEIIKKIYLRNINLLGDIDKYKNRLFIKVRSTGKLIKAVAKIKENETEVDLKEDEAGISPGQACVFYSANKLGDKVLGGGWITQTINKYLST